MYGLITKMIATPGNRDQLAQILIAGSRDMNGCESYTVARDLADENAVWITEIWASKTHHSDSLSLASVKDAIEKGRPLIAGFGGRFETEPLK